MCKMKNRVLAIFLTLALFASALMTNRLISVSAEAEILYKQSMLGGWCYDSTSIGTRTEEAVTGDPRFDSCMAFQVTEAESGMYKGYFYIGSSLDGERSNKADLTSVYDTGYVRFWVKSEQVGKKFTVNLENGDPWGMSNPVTVTIEKNDRWQEVRIPLTAFEGKEKYTGVENVRIWASGLLDGESFAPGTTFRIAGFAIYSQVPPDIAGPDDGDGEETAKIIYKQSMLGGWCYDSTSIGTRTEEAVTGDPRFDSCMAFQVTEAESGMYKGYFYIGSSLDGERSNKADLTSVYDTGYVRFWVKSEQVGKKFTVNLENGDPWGMSNPVTVTIEKNDRWQEVRIPLTAFEGKEKYTGVENVRIWASGLLDGESFAPGTTFRIAGFAIYSQVPPDIAGPDDGDGEDIPDVIYIGSKIGGWSNGNAGALSRREIENDPRFDSCFLITFKDLTDGYLGIGNSLDGVTAASANVAQVKDTGYLRFWMKSDKAGRSVTLNLEDSVTWGLSHPVTITVRKSGAWEEVRIPLSDLYKEAAGMTSIANIRLSLGELDASQAFQSGEQLKIAGLKIYSGEPEDMSQYDDLDSDIKEIESKKIFATAWLSNGWGGGNPGPINRARISGDPRFDYCYVIHAADLNGDNSCYLLYSSLNGYAFNRVDLGDCMDTGYVRFWVRSEYVGRKFTVSLENAEPWAMTQPYMVTVQENNRWQEVRIPLAAFSADGEKFRAVGNVRIAAYETFAENETFRIAGLSIYSGEPEDMSEYENLGAETRPEKDDGSYASYGESNVIGELNYANPPFTGKEKMGTVETVDIDDLGRFDKAYRWTIGEDFIQAPGAGYLFFMEDDVDVSECLRTGYLSFYVKSSVAPARIMFTVADDCEVWSDTWYYTIEKANEWQEVRISLYDLIPEGTLDPEYVTSLLITNDYQMFQCGNAGLPAFSGEGYLNPGDTLMISGLRFTDGKPLKPETAPEDDQPSVPDEPKPPVAGVPAVCGGALFAAAISGAAVAVFGRRKTQSRRKDR